MYSRRAAFMLQVWQNTSPSLAFCNVLQLVSRISQASLVMSVTTCQVDVTVPVTPRLCGLYLLMHGIPGVYGCYSALPELRNDMFIFYALVNEHNETCERLLRVSSEQVTRHLANVSNILLVIGLLYLYPPQTWSRNLVWGIAVPILPAAGGGDGEVGLPLF